MTKDLLATTALSTTGATAVMSGKGNDHQDRLTGVAGQVGVEAGATITEVLGPYFDREYWETLEVIPTPVVIATAQQTGCSAEQQAAWANRLQLTEHMIDLFVSGSAQAGSVNSAASIATDGAQQSTSAPHIKDRDQKLRARLVSDLASVRAPDGTALSQQQIAEMYQPAAEHGDPVALFNLGRMYFHGVGVERSGSEAEECFCHIALRGRLGPVIYIRCLMMG